MFYDWPGKEPWFHVKAYNSQQRGRGFEARFAIRQISKENDCKKFCFNIEVANSANIIQ